MTLSPASAQIIPLPLARRARATPRRSLSAPSAELPRERLLARGAATLSDTELIALLLGTGAPGQNVFALADTLLARFGSVRALLDATPDDFRALRGIGPARSALLVAVFELARRALAERARALPLVDSPGAVEDYLRLAIGSRPHEVFVCLFLDIRHRLLCCEESARGSIARMAVYPREIVRRALALNAASLIVAHNHPSGAVKPSASDLSLTQSLKAALGLVEIQLLDHLIISADATFSFAQAGLMGKLDKS